MAKGNFIKIMQPLLAHEGGWSNRPLADDPGGATYKGVIQRTYDSFRRGQGQEARSVRNMTDEEMLAIYDFQFWRPICGDLLPLGVDYAVFDGAVNSGPGQASKWLQRALKQQSCYDGVIDGDIGIGTVNGCNEADTQELIISICDQRLAFMKTLSNWAANRNGWTRRVNEVKSAALAMAGGRKNLPPITPMKAEETAKATATQTNVTDTPTGNLSAKLVPAGILNLLLNGLNQASDYLGYLTGLPTWMIQWLIFAAIFCTIVASVSFVAIALYKLIQRKKFGEQVEAP